MKEITKERLLLIRDHLKTIPEARFNLASWANDLNEENECGTMGCAIGHACSIPAFKQLGLTLQKYGVLTCVVFKGKYDFDAVLSLLEMEGSFKITTDRSDRGGEYQTSSMGACHHLFHPGFYPINGNPSVSRQEVISRIDEFIADNL